MPMPKVPYLTSADALTTLSGVTVIVERCIRFKHVNINLSIYQSIIRSIYHSIYRLIFPIRVHFATLNLFVAVAYRSNPA